MLRKIKTTQVLHVLTQAVKEDGLKTCLLYLALSVTVNLQHLSNDMEICCYTSSLNLLFFTKAF